MNIHRKKDFFDQLLDVLMIAVGIVLLPLLLLVFCVIFIGGSAADFTRLK